METEEITIDELKLIALMSEFLRVGKHLTTTDQIFDTVINYSDKIKKVFASQDKWVSVEERLPNESGKYLCLINEPTGPCHEIVSFTDIHEDDKFEFYGYYCTSFTRTLTHWQKLPKAPLTQ